MRLGGTVRRCVRAAATVALSVVLAFVLLHLAPDDAARGDDPRTTAADRSADRSAAGDDRSIAAQFVEYSARLCRGDLGRSRRYGQPVSALIGAAIAPSVLLGLTALAVAFGGGLLLGTAAALRPRGVADGLVRRVLPLLDACPTFWLGMLAVLVFSGWLGWLPASHLAEAGVEHPGVLDLLRHLALPALTIGIPGIAPVARHHALALTAALEAPDARIARALGLPRRRVVARAQRLALQPALALFGLALPGIAGGTAVIEVLFSWPGLGRLQQEAWLGRDLPLAMGGLLVVALLVVCGGLLADLAAAALDPRQRTSS